MTNPMEFPMHSVFVLINVSLVCTAFQWAVFFVIFVALASLLFFFG